MRFAIRNGRGRYLGADGYAHAKLEVGGRTQTVVDGNTLVHRLSWWKKDNPDYRDDISVVAVEHVDFWREVA